MCSAWQSLGFWSMTGLAFLAGLAMGSPGGWYAHSVRQWHRRTMLNLRFLGPLIRLGGYVLGVVAVGGLLIYGWLVY